MRLRAVFFDGVMLLLWAFIAFIYHGFYGFNILLSGLGVVFGLVFGVAVTLKYISSLEKNGEFKATLKTLAFTLLTLIIIVPIALYLLFRFGLEAGKQMLSFLYPSVPAVYAGRIVLFLSWERKHEKLILFDGPKVYAVPRTERR